DGRDSGVARMNALKDCGAAVFIVLVLAAFGSAAGTDTAEDRTLDARVAALLDAYAQPEGELLRQPSVVVANLDGPAVASSNCDEWRIRVRRGAVEALSDAALDELLAHELAHLVVCAETGRSAGHGADWWQRYHALIDLT